MIFEHAGIPLNAGWIVLDDIFIKVWEEKGSPGWIRDHEKEMSAIAKQASLNFTNKGITEDERIKVRKDFRKWLFGEFKTLTEESREYYKRVNKPIKPSTAYLPEITEEEI